MYKRRFLVLFVGFLGLSISVFASVQIPISNCDTLITNAGQILLVHIESGSNDSIVRFTYCGESGLKPEVQPRSNFKQIKRSAVPAGNIASKGLPEGSEPVESDVAPKGLPEGSEPVELIIAGKSPAANAEKLSTWTKVGAIGGFGSVFMILFAFAFNPLMIMLILPLSIIGLIFSLKVLKRTKNRPEFKKQRRISKWSLAMSFAWIGLSILYILFAILFLLLFFI